MEDNLPVDDESHFLKLDYDSVLHIFSFVTLLDQYQLSRTCTRLNEIAKMQFRKVRVNFNRTGFRTVSEAKKAFAKYGKHVEHIYFFGYNQKVCAEIFLPMCANLISIEFDAIKMPSHLFLNLLPVFQQLESITLRSCGLNDDIFEVLQFCRKLKKLDLSSNSSLHGNGIQKLPNTVEDLNLAACYDIELTSMIQLCRVAKFRKLNIDSNSKYNEFVFEEIGRMETLEAIIFSVFAAAADFTALARIPNLTNLAIRHNPSNNDEFFQTLANEKSNSLTKLCFIISRLNELTLDVICSFVNLKYLCIVGTADDDILARLCNSKLDLTHFSVFDSQHVSGNAILNFVEKSKNMQVLDIAHCRQFEQSFVIALIEKLKNIKRSTVLKLIVGNTKICSSVEDETIFRDFRHLIKMYYNLSDSLMYLWTHYRPTYDYHDTFSEVFQRD